MVLIKIDVEAVRSKGSSLNRAAAGLSDCGSGLASMQYRIDSKILARHSIQGKISRASSSLHQVEKDLHEMKNFIHQAMDMYSAAEKRLNGQAKITFQEKNLTPLVQGQGVSAAMKDGFDLLGFLDDLGKYAVTAQGIFGAGLVLGKQINFLRKNNNRTQAVIRSAQWIKGRGTNEFLKRLGRRMSKAIQHPGPILKGVMKADAFIEKFGKAQVLGISKAKNLDHFLKTVIVGVEEHTHGIKTAKIPGMIAKRVYPIDAALNVVSESVTVYDEIKKGTFDGKDLAVAGSNVIIKTGATTVGALAGGALGTLFGPGGAAVGSFMGGTAGAWVGDSVAGFAENVIRKGPKEAFASAGESAVKTAKKGFSWVKGIFK